MKIKCDIWYRDQLPLGATAPFSIESGGPVVGEAEVIEDEGERRILITIQKGHEDEVLKAMEIPRNISINSVCLGEETKCLNSLLQD